MGGGWPKRFCCDEELAFIGYDGRDAAKDLEALRSEGPRRWSRELIDVLVANRVGGSTVLDVGAGVGAVHLALLEAGAERALDVDASREYIDAARAEAHRRGLAGRVEYRYGDLVELAAGLPAADVVVMDSVICCYPYLDRLVSAALGPGPRLLGITYPRDVWWMVAFMRLYNAAHGVRGSPSRYFIHRHAAVRGALAHHGFEQIHDGGTAPWRVVVFQRMPDGRRNPVLRPTTGSATPTDGRIVAVGSTQAPPVDHDRSGPRPGTRKG